MSEVLKNRKMEQRHNKNISNSKKRFVYSLRRCLTTLGSKMARKSDTIKLNNKALKSRFSSLSLGKVPAAISLINIINQALISNANIAEINVIKKLSINRRLNIAFGVAPILAHIA